MFHNSKLIFLALQPIHVTLLPGLLSFLLFFFFCLLDIQPAALLLRFPRPHAFQSVHRNTWALIFSPKPTHCSPAASFAPSFLTLLIFSASHIHLHPSYQQPHSSSLRHLSLQPALLRCDHARGMALGPEVLISAALLITHCTLINCCITS